MITGIGSLPHRDPAEAALFVLGTTDVPYLPQLPNRHAMERMLPQWGVGLCGCGYSASELGLAYESDQLDRLEAFGGSNTLLQMLAPDTPSVKTQATGPVTLAAAMLAAGHPGGDALFDCLAEGLAIRINAHVAGIRSVLPATEMIFLLDEPALAGLGNSAFPIDVDSAWTLIRSVMDQLPFPVGIHCCGPTDWSFVSSFDPAWIALDIDALGPQFEEDGEALAAAVANGTRIMWGVSPAVMGSPPRDLVSRLQRAIGTLVLGGADMTSLTSDAMYTPSCGLAGITEGQAEVVAVTVRTVVGELAELWTT